MTTTPDRHSADWTRAPGRGANTSDAFLAAVDRVERRLGECGRAVLDPKWVRSTAVLIVAQLAHRDGLRPAEVPPIDWDQIRDGVLTLIRERSTPVVSFEDLADTITVWFQAQLHPTEPRRIEG